jgi:ParB-like chromosome segregation protein Spo0J
MEYAVEFIKVKDIKPYKKNAKKHPQEQIEYIKNSIKEFGFRQNLVIDKNNKVVIGHGRLLAENCFLGTKKEEHYALCL